MLKAFITKPFLKRSSYFLVLFFFLLFVYHVIRYYFLGLDCDFIQGKMNKMIESFIIPIGLISTLFTVIQIIAEAIFKSLKKILLNVGFLLVVVFCGIKYVDNTMFECFLYGVDLLNLQGIFSPH